MRLPTLPALLLAALLAAALPAAARTDRAAGPAIEPEAVAALQKMGRYLQTLKTFSVKGTNSAEEVLPNGLKVQHDTVATLVAARPDRVRSEQTSDRLHRLLVYDGGSFSLYSKSSGYYVQVPVTATLAQLAGKLAADYRVDLPLLDLFAWGDDSAQKPELKLARVVGFATVRGVGCDQYAFRQDGSDWQVWIQRGANPLPRRLVVTDTTQEARPQLMAEYDWGLNPQLAPAAFAFKAPPGAVSVSLARAKEIAVPRR